ncbi:methyltransferase [Actinomadura sp. 7K534]|uniref:methyltransferase n=1 Tax=Actinomadura sp. 7K534 TaxID=2530366 RepID=UPI0010469526|nr:methyltransferase [Actinomadura sp. 7K534]TDB98542.1 methyltransferase [Actinomadura sp. 7K534]
MTVVDEVPGAVVARQMVFGQLLSRAVCTAAELGLSDLLAGGPLTVAELADRARVDPRRLTQLMRCLAAFGVYSGGSDGSYELTAVGATLCTGAAGSALPTALLAAGEVGAAWAGMLGTVRTGRTAFDELLGESFFEHLGRDGRLRELFDRSQSHDQELEIDQLLAAVDFSRHRRIVDVGGGDGTLLARLLQAHPRAEGVLLDDAKTAANARTRMHRAGLANRCTSVGGDFFSAVPADGDLYLLRQILHDWDDERCVRLLRVCRRAMRPGTRLLVIERIVEEGATGEDARFAALMDLYMMTVVGGAERTAGEFGDLLAKADFTVEAVHRLPTAGAVIDARAGAVVS